MLFSITATKVISRGNRKRYSEVLDSLAVGSFTVHSEHPPIVEPNVALVHPALSVIELFFMSELMQGRHFIPFAESERAISTKCEKGVFTIESITGPGYEIPVNRVIVREDVLELLTQLRTILEDVSLSWQEQQLLLSNPFLRLVLPLNLASRK